MAIKKGIPMRAPRKTVSSSNSSTHQCINVTLLLETLLKNQSNLNLNNNRFRILPVSIKKKEREIIPEVINNSFGRGKRSASAAVTTTSSTSRRVATTGDSKKPRGRKTVEITTTSTSPARFYNNNSNNNSNTVGGVGGSSMIRSSSASASHHRHLEEHTPSPLARSFSVGIDGEETSNSYSNKSLTKSLTTTGRIVSQRPNHFNDYEMAYVS